MRIIILICVFVSIIVIALGGWFLFRYMKSHTPNAVVTDGASSTSQESSYDPIAEYDKQCSGDEEDLECSYLQAEVSAQTLQALETIEYARDQRGVGVALEALDLDEEPELQIQACRILALFPNEPGIKEKLPQLMFSPYASVQRMAAQMMSRYLDQDAAFGSMGYQWNQNHGDFQISNPYVEYEVPQSYASIGFPEYPAAEHFPPADSDRSVGWMTSDSAAIVENELSTKLGVKSMSYTEWYERNQQKYSAVPKTDEAGMAEVQKLLEQYAKTQDPKLFEQAQEMQKKMAEPFEAATAVMEKDVEKAALPPAGISADTVRYLIAEERDGRMTKVIMIYPQQAIQKTVIAMVWNLNDYPKAW